MPKRYLHDEEWYPVLSLRASKYDWDDSEPVEFSDEELADLARVGREFYNWQKKIAERFDLLEKGKGSLGASEILDDTNS